MLPVRTIINFSGDELSEKILEVAILCYEYSLLLAGDLNQLFVRCGISIWQVKCMQGVKTWMI